MVAKSQSVLSTPRKRSTVSSFWASLFGDRSSVYILLALTILLLLTASAHAQGCAQCLDSTRATPPQVQAAYRHAIYLLGGFGVSLFLAGTLLIRSKQ